MLRFEAIGTAWSIETEHPLSASLADELADLIEGFDLDWSRFRDDSLVTRIASRPGEWRLPSTAGPLLDTYRHLYEATDGAVSPLVGRAMENLGYDAAYSLRDTGVRVAAPVWTDALEWNGETLTTLTPALLDVGAAGKGYLVDLVSQLLLAHGHADHVVDASGDIVHAGSGATRVALEHPFDSSKAIGVVSLSRGALCASASNRRAWGDGLHHVIDASTGMPTNDVAATWVLAPEARVADGLATGLFFAGAERFDALAPFQWVRMMANGRVQHSADFEGELFA